MADRYDDERGQGLVEYALILALVSLGAIVALGFLSGQINGLFSKAGNSLNNVSLAGGGGGSTPPPGPTPPPDGTPVADFTTSSNAFGRWYNGNGATNNPQGLSGAPTAASGLYSTTDGRSGTCSFTAANGYTFTGTWHPTGSEPAQWEWNATGDGLDGDLLSACYGTLGGPGGGEPPTNAPTNGTLASTFPTSSNVSGIWWNGDIANTNPDGHNGAANGVSGLYTTTDGMSGSCSFTASNGFTMLGTWHPTSSESGSWTWNIEGDGPGTTTYLSACY